MTYALRRRFLDRLFTKGGDVLKSRYLPAAVLVLAFVDFALGALSLLELIGLTVGAFSCKAMLRGASEVEIQRATAHGFIVGSLLGLAFLLISRL